MEQLQSWTGCWGDLASVIGAALTFIGFLLTIAGVWRSKSAAEGAQRAAEATRASLAQYDAVADLAAATGLMDEIKRLQRLQAWPVLPDRYAELRRRLVAVKSSDARLTDRQRQVFQATVEKFADLERRIERWLAKGTTPNPAKLNDIVSSQIDEVQAVLLAVQRNLGQRHER